MSNLQELIKEFRINDDTHGRQLTTLFSDDGVIAVPEGFERDGGITAYWIAKTLLSGALSYAGKKVMESFFSSDSDVTAISEIVYRAVEELKNYISKAIEEEAVRQARVSLLNAQTTLNEYFRAPTDARLELATDSSVMAVNALNTLTLAGHQSYIAAVCLRILILQERAQRFPENREGELLNIVAQIDVALAHHAKMTENWKAWIEEQYELRTVCMDVFCGFWLFWKGSLVRKFGNLHVKEGKHIPVKQQHSIDTYNNTIYPNQIQGGEEAAKKWKAIKQGVLTSIEMGDISNETLIAQTVLANNG